MESNSPSLEQFLDQSSTSPERDVRDLSKGVNVVGVPLVRLIKLIGFRKALRSKIVRWRYIERLWMLREIYIIKVLCDNYEKIPKFSWSYLIVGFVKRCKLLKFVLLPLEKRLLNVLIQKPYEIRKTGNNSSNSEDHE